MSTGAKRISITCSIWVPYLYVIFIHKCVKPFTIHFLPFKDIVHHIINQPPNQPGIYICIDEYYISRKKTLKQTPVALYTLDSERCTRFMLCHDCKSDKIANLNNQVESGR